MATAQGWALKGGTACRLVTRKRGERELFVLSSKQGHQESVIHEDLHLLFTKQSAAFLNEDNL